MFKCLFASFVLCLASHGQTLKWERSIGFPSDWTVASSALFPDGVGGGAAMVDMHTPTGSLSRVVWFSSRGVIKATIDIQTSGPQPVRNTPRVFRVTPSAFDVYSITSEGVIVLQHFRKGRAMWETALDEGDQTYVVAVPANDRMGFFSNKTSPTNFLIRRWAY